MAVGYVYNDVGTVVVQRYGQTSVQTKKPSSSKVRTCDLTVNSRTLYQLSYRGLDNYQRNTYKPIVFAAYFKPSLTRKRTSILLTHFHRTQHN